MQYKIPQNVGIEDKIVGPLTLRQLIILAVGFGLSYVLFSVLNQFYELNILEYGVIALPFLLAAAFALVKINDITLTKYLFLFLEFSIKPKKRVWDHRGISNIVSPDLSSSIAPQAKVDDDHIEEDKESKIKNLQELTQQLDSGAFGHLQEKNHHDIDEVHDDDLVTQAYFGHKKNATENMYWRTKSSHLEMLNIFAELPVTKLKKGTKETAIAKREIKKIKEEVDEYKAKNSQKVISPKKRKRRKPTKVIRPHQPVNTLAKKSTSQDLRKENQSEKNADEKKIIRSSKSGEFDISQLSDIDTIEINLD